MFICVSVMGDFLSVLLMMEIKVFLILEVMF